MLYSLDLCVSFSSLCVVKKQAKNVYESALLRELTTDRGIQAICKAIDEKYVTESTAWCWYEQGRLNCNVVKHIREKT